jgi:copper chaperone
MSNQMISEKLHIANMKCNGCATSITAKINEIEGVYTTEVNIEEGTINVDYQEDNVREHIITKLSAMGYPEATAENGLLMKAKSYANCMIGKVS